MAEKGVFTSDWTYRSIGEKSAETAQNHRPQNRKPDGFGCVGVLFGDDQPGGGLAFYGWLQLAIAYMLLCNNTNKSLLTPASPGEGFAMGAACPNNAQPVCNTNLVKGI